MSAVFPTEDFRAALLAWFKHEGKSYPWRKTTNPWYILVSEFMLQQTTIPTVLARYDNWMQLFPTPQSLAAVNEETALRSWEGLGYYRRVKSLRNIAIAVVEKYNGVFPKDPKLLMQLPGIGEYTCGALLSFAFNIPAPIVDTNVSRVIARLDNYKESVDSNPGKKYMWARATELVDPVNPRFFNSAMMELGQTYCKSQSVDCLLCPVRKFCSAESPLSIPIKTAKEKYIPLIHHDILCVRNGKILLSKQDNGRHLGMYRFPERTEKEVSIMPLVLTQKYNVTKYKVTRYLHLTTDASPISENEFFIDLMDIDALPMASPDRKVLRSAKIGKLFKHTL